MTTPIEDQEIVLTSGDLRLTVAPYGASLRGLEQRGADGAWNAVVSTYHGLKAKAGGQGDVLIPFPGRIKNGHYKFGQNEHQLVQNDVETPSAIHGFLRHVVWDETHAADSVTFTSAIAPETYPGYPFALTVSLTYTLTQAGLVCQFAIENTGTITAPVSAGFHPYFTVGSDLVNADTLELPFNSYLEFENLIPTGKVLDVAGSPFDFRTPRPIGDLVINVCFASPIRGDDGLLRVTLSNSDTNRSVTVWQDESINYMVLYSGDPMPETHRRKALAIEPMTCATDAFNHHAWGLVALDPGETFSGEWGVDLS